MTDRSTADIMASASDTPATAGRRRLPRALLVLVVVIVLLAAAWAVSGKVEITRRWDTSAITSVQLNGGTMTLVADDEDYLTAKLPLRALPVLMTRRTDGLLEAGGFDDSDPRVLLTFLMPFSDVPVHVDKVQWELHTSKLRRVTVAGGMLRSDSFHTDYFELFGGSGRAELVGLDIGTLAVHAQDGAVVVLAGDAETYSVMNSGGNIDVDDLHYERYDESVIQKIFGDF